MKPANRLATVRMSALSGTLLPGVHNQLILNYVPACGGCIGVATEPPRFDALFCAFR